MQGRKPNIPRTLIAQPEQPTCKAGHLDCRIEGHHWHDTFISRKVSDTPQHTTTNKTDVVPPGPGELAPEPLFRVEAAIDIDRDGRERQTGWEVTHPEWSVDGFNEVCMGVIATFPMGAMNEADWVARALNYRAKAECDADR